MVQWEGRVAVLGDDRSSIYYLTTSETDDDWQIGCVDAGRHRVSPGDPYPPQPRLHPPGYVESLSQGRVLSEYQLIFISQGRGRLAMGSSEFTVEAGTAFVLFPGVRHSYGPDPTTGWVEYWVGFRGPQVDWLTKKGFLTVDDPVYPSGLGPSGVLEFQQLLEGIAEEAPGFRLVAASRVLLLLSRLVASRRSGSQTDGAQAIVAQAKLGLEEQATSHSVDFPALAKKLGLASSSLSSLFHQYTGLTPHQYWLNLKINRAKVQLSSGKSVKEVSYALGFESEFYFSRLFKKKTGFPPSRWGR